MENNKYSDEEIERYTLSSPQEIVAQIRGLIKRRNRLSVAYHGGQQNFLTILLDVSPQDRLLYFDVSGSPEVNRAFLNAENGIFTTFVDGISIRFSIQNSRKTTLNGEPAFAAPIPESMIRLQRRDMFRLQLPSARPFTCCICKDSPEEAALPLHDISVGGVGVLFAISPNYSQLDKLENCLIDLRSVGSVSCSLEVRHVHEVKNRTGKSFWHMGCRFVDLLPSDEMLIHRFMAKVEAERRALSPD